MGYGGTYTITVTAVLQEVYYYQGTSNPPFYTNSNLNYQQTIVDPCITTLVNNLPFPYNGLNCVIPTLTTSIKYGQYGSSPFSYTQNPSGKYTFVTFVDSVSRLYGTYGTVASDYCGPRVYTLGG